MELSSPRFKSLSLSAGFSFWFFLITHTLGVFSIELVISFIAGIVITTQIFAVKFSKALDIFSIINTKIFLGVLFVLVISIYGILFRVLRIDLLRLQKQRDTYWLDIETVKTERIFKQY